MLKLLGMKKIFQSKVNTFAVYVVLIVAMSVLFVGTKVMAQYSVTDRTVGYIVLQVEENGEAWYVNPTDELRYYMKDGATAYQMMRAFGLGISNSDLDKLLAGDAALVNQLRGRIVLQVEDLGQAYYIHPDDGVGHYLADGDAAYEVMRFLSLGITNNDLFKISEGSVDEAEGALDDTDTSDSGDDTVTLSSAVVDTNQTECFGSSSSISCPSSGASYYGQDGNYSSTQPSYSDNGNGTVTDNVTGLMWTQGYEGKDTYYNSISTAAGYEYAGYSDWRAPTIKELYSLMDFSGVDFADAGNLDYAFIDTDYFDFEYGDTSAGDRAIDSQWVTSNVYVDTVMGNSECFFGVNFADGRIKCYPTNGMNNGYFLRLVRGDSYGNNNFVDNGNGTVTDSSVDLMWQQSDSGSGFNWDSALSYCEELNLAGQTDWRLPNAKELQYLLDYSRSPSTTSSPAIDSIFSTTSITNEAGDTDYPFYWTGTTHENQMGGSAAVYIAFGRALGYMNGEWIDVHGAGAQRSDQKTGSADSYPEGHGPQGDAVRIDNYARCVR